MLLTRKQEMIYDAIRTLVREVIAPHAVTRDHGAMFPRDMRRQLGELGACSATVLEELGGARLDYLSLALILEETTIGDGGASTVTSMNDYPMCSMLMAFVNDAQKQQWLVPSTCGEMLGVFCLAEPHVGPDASALRTTAVRDGDHWVLNGVKQLTTSGKHTDVVTVMTVTDKTAGKHDISTFLVPTNIPSYVVARLEDEPGQYPSDTAWTVFEDCRIPADCLLSEEGTGYKMALSGLKGGRIGIATQSIDMARATLEAALACAKERESSDQPLSAYQAMQFRLAEMATCVDVARQVIWHAASLKDAGLPCLKEAAMAKLNASGVAERVCSDAIQVFGGYGYVSDFPVERIHHDVCVCQIYEGTSDIQKILIARVLAQTVSGRAQHNRGSTP